MCRIWAVSIFHLLRHKRPLAKPKNRVGPAISKALVDVELKISPHGPSCAGGLWAEAIGVRIADGLDCSEQLAKWKCLFRFLLVGRG